MTTSKSSLTLKQKRLIEGTQSLYEQDKPEIVFAHSTMCQTCLPFSKPKEDVREWKSKNGRSSVFLKAGEVYNKDTDELFKVPLPYGPKPRLLLYYLNSQAIKQQSALIEVEPTLGQLIQRLGFESNGRDYKTVKDQFTCLSASQMIIGRGEADGSSTTEYRRIVDATNLWYSKEGKQTTLWPNVVRLSGEYFNSLHQHAVPLDDGAISLIKDSALALDIYTMLAERLHRIPYDKPAFIPWAALHQLYGSNYKDIRKFRQKFREALTQVMAVYPDARIEDEKDASGNPKGLRLKNSKPPIQKTSLLISGAVDE